MQIVIEIPTDTYEYIKEGTETSIDEGEAIYAIRHGKVLPENHGDLIDANAFNQFIQSADYDTYNDYSNTFNWIENFPVILEGVK